MRVVLASLLSAALVLTGCATTGGAGYSAQDAEATGESTSHDWVWWALGALAIGAALAAGGGSESHDVQAGDTTIDSDTGGCVVDICVPGP